LLRNIEFLADYFGAEEIEIPVAVTKRLSRGGEARSLESVWPKCADGVQR